jgi:hypothetical protein
VLRLRVSIPIVVLALGCCLLGVGVAGVARVDAPLQAAVAPQQAPPPQRQDAEVTWHRHRGDCPPRRAART